MNSNTLNLYFRGQRKYVQGSLILTQVAQYAGPMLSIDDSQLELGDVKFLKVLDGNACVVLDTDKIVDEQSLYASIDVQIVGGSVKKLCVLGLGGGPESIPRVEDSQKVAKDINFRENDCFDSRYRSDGSADAIWRAVVETIKYQLESELNASQVMFLGVMGRSMLVSDIKGFRIGEISCKKLFSKPNNDRVMVIHDVEIADDESGLKSNFKTIFDYQP